MATTLENFDPEPEVKEEATDDPGTDFTLEDLGEDKELNAAPSGETPDDDLAQEEAEADKPEETSEEAKDAAVAQKQTADQAAPKTDVEKTTEDILKHLGMDSTLKIKGKEYKLSDFGKEDLLTMVQKGARMTQIGQELSQRERLLAERERVAEQNALQATQLLQHARPGTPRAEQVETEPPKDLVPSEYDTEDVKAVKQVALTMWKQNQDQAKRLNDIEGGLKNQQTEAESQKFMDELNRHRADFPLASVEEVIAVHSLRPDIPISDLVRRSHGIYGSSDHIDEVFKLCPEVRKHYEDKFVADYLARQGKTRVPAQKPSSQGVRPAPATKTVIRDFESAGQAAKKAMARIARELEGDSD
jgi:hypothetical protein